MAELVSAICQKSLVSGSLDFAILMPRLNTDYFLTPSLEIKDQSVIYFLRESGKGYYQFRLYQQHDEP